MSWRMFASSWFRLAICSTVKVTGCSGKTMAEHGGSVALKSRRFAGSGDKCVHRFAQSIARDVELALLDLIRQLRRNTHGPINRRVQIFDNHAILQCFAGPLVG